MRSFLYKTFIFFIALTCISPNVHAVSGESGADCKDYWIIFLRGSGEELNDGISFITLSNAINREFSQLSGFSYGLLNLAYSAVAIKRPVQIYFSAGTAAEFGKSVSDGIVLLRDTIRQLQVGCPNTKFALVGYSQGSMVINKTLSSLDANKFIYIATVSDPKLYLPEGQGSASECLTGHFSEYRVDVPECFISSGALGASVPYHPKKFAGKVGTWCNPLDFICGSSLNLFDITGGHTSYVKTGKYEKVAELITQKLKEDLKNRPNTKSDVIIFLDRHIYTEGDAQSILSTVSYAKNYTIYTYTQDLSQPYNINSIITNRFIINKNVNLDGPYNSLHQAIETALATNHKFDEAIIVNQDSSFFSLTPEELPSVLLNTTKARAATTATPVILASANSTITNSTYQNNSLELTLSLPNSATGVILTMNEAPLGVLDLDTLKEFGYKIVINDIDESIDNNIEIRIVNSAGRVSEILTYEMPAGSAGNVQEQTGSDDNNQNQTTSPEDDSSDKTDDFNLKNLPTVPDCGTANKGN